MVYYIQTLDARLPTAGTATVTNRVKGTYVKAEEFFEYLTKNVAAFQSSQALDTFKKSLAGRNLQILTEEMFFKITVQAKVNSATRRIEAWVTQGPAQGGKSTTAPPPLSGAGPPSGTSAGASQGSETGLTITFMKVQ